MADRGQKFAGTKGLYAEARFLLECVKRNFHLSKPVHPGSVYDYLLDSGKKIHRVQVKFTSCKNPSGNFRLTCAKGSTSKYSKRQKYYSNEIDYLIGLTSADDWYIIPMKLSPTTCVTLAKKYDKYKNNWSVFE